MSKQEILAACTTTDSNGVVKMKRRGLIEYMAKTSGKHVNECAEAYDLVMTSIRDVVAHKVRLSLSGFGVFHLQTHKGHPVQFQKGGNQTADYLVFKFSASNALNQYVRSMAKPGEDS